MSELSPERSGEAFVQALVRAGRVEAPPSAAKARALAAIGAGAAGAARAASSVTFGAMRAVFGRGVGATVSVAVAAAAAAGVGIHLRGRPAADPASIAAASAAIEAAAMNRLPVTPGATGASPAQPGAASRAAPSADACERVDLPESQPSSCSTDGQREDMEVVNTCGGVVDVYWVDFKCRESFVARIAPGESLRQSTYDTHPWRVRDHTTRRLIKEWVGPKLPEPPKEAVALADLVIEDGMSRDDATPTVCSRPSNPASLTFVNRRTTGVSVLFWVDYACHEQVKHRLDPGESWTSHTYDAHPWRVRDEAGALLADYVPDGVDQTVYVSLP